MGIKLRDNVNSISASFKDSKLRYHIGSKEYVIDIPAVKTLVFEEQCNHFKCPKVLAYFVGEVYSMVIRCDGTGTVFTTNGAILCKLFKYDVPNFNDFYVTRGGAIKQKRHARYEMVELFTNGKDYIISIPSAPISLSFQLADNPLYIQDLMAYRTETYPEMRIIENKVFTVDAEGAVVYQIHGNLMVGEGVIVL